MLVRERVYTVMMQISGSKVIFRDHGFAFLKRGYVSEIIYQACDFKFNSPVNTELQLGHDGCRGDQ
ncbi:hypothetical protein GCM10022277_21600 [Litoribacillus peritrichatus]|uniref:Uncharacterized protein n=1 Tax=Litoribacillus peritrichatus TaxID=718191 RepID=A0ABP7MNN0_9GAMM